MRHRSLRSAPAQVKRAALALALSSIVAGVFAGCASFPATFCDYGFCSAGPAQDSGTEGGPPVPPGCDTPTEPAKNPLKCLVDDFGAYVSAENGNDANAGTKDKPFKTIGKALSTTQPRIVVCAGTYTESLDITRPVEIFGSVACTFDKGGARSKLVATKPAYAARISKADGVRLADLDLESQAGVEPGEGSFALVVADSPRVNLVRLKAEAKDGVPGKDGQLVPYVFDDTNIDGKIPAGGSSGACKGGGASAGGGGGPGVGAGGNGTPPPPVGGLGGTVAQCEAGQGGNTGTEGDPGGPGPGASSVGAVTSAGWVGTAGSNGVPGKPGGGGGGGAARNGIAGGGGGAGGCGGAGGGGGAPGGSSIAVVVYASEVTFHECDLHAGAPGGGGVGAASSQPGQRGGTAGSPVADGCKGAPGMAGGRGGVGGGGAGGVSAGIAWTGKEPAFAGITKIARADGSAVAPGGAGSEQNDGTKGVNIDVLRAP